MNNATCVFSVTRLSEKYKHVCVHCGKVIKSLRANVVARCNIWLDPCASALELTLNQCQPFIQQLAQWCAAGMPERTEEEKTTLQAICRACGDYGTEADLPDGTHWDEQCLHGCTNAMKKREKRPPLEPLWRMATTRCPAEKWPRDAAIDKAEKVAAENGTPVETVVNPQLNLRDSVL